MFSKLIGGGSIAMESILHATKIDAAGGAAAVITVAKAVETRIILSRVVWSYSAVPTGGKVTITGSGTSFEFDITAAGPGSLPLLYVCSINVDCVITLAGGGGAIVGKVNVEYSLER